jgi:hypothetical protein
VSCHKLACSDGILLEAEVGSADGGDIWLEDGRDLVEADQPLLHVEPQLVLVFGQERHDAFPRGHEVQRDDRGVSQQEAVPRFERVFVNVVEAVVDWEVGVLHRLFDGARCVQEASK